MNSDKHDAGGKTYPLPAGVIGSAIYGGERNCYRYWLSWSMSNFPTGPVLLACMMNPSVATEQVADATLLWVWRWGTRNGFTRLVVVNADAYRCRDQARLAEVEDPCGPKNHDHIRAAVRTADMIVIGHGKPKVRAVRDHGPRMVDLLRSTERRLHVWGLSKDGTPKHPLYLPADTPAVEWSPP
jgi:hypothetical protein